MTDDILSRYPQTAGNPRAQAMLSQVLHARGLVSDAFALGLAAVEGAPDDIEVRDMVRHGLSSGVPGWHVPMLWDNPRNRCYAEAIARAVKPGMLVVEIGTGAGLLSLLAARAGAQVVTCEMNPAVAAAATEIVRRNGFADRIRVVQKLSSALEVGVDLPEHADLLMSELFDDTIFGDGIVEYLADARARLLKPGAPILPPRSELRCALVSTEVPRRLQPLGMVEGFDLSAFNVLAPPGPRQVRVRAVPAEQRSDPVSALPMDYDAPAPFGATGQQIALRSRGGRVNGIAQWMRVDFGDGIVYENDPFDGEWSHWGSPIHAFAEAIETTEGEVVTASVRLVGRQIVMRPIND